MCGLRLHWVLGSCSNLIEKTKQYKWKSLLQSYKTQIKVLAGSVLDQSRFEQPGLGTPILSMAESIYNHFLISIFGCRLLEKRKSNTKLVIN